VGKFSNFQSISRGGRGASNDSAVVKNGNFQRFCRLSFLETLETRSALLYSNTLTHSVVSFSVIPKCMLLNDLEWLICVKFCFCAGLTGSDCATFD